MSRQSSLVDRQADFTRRLILEAALALVEDSVDMRLQAPIVRAHEVTLRAVARRADISERTMFRYFSTREEFFDALAERFRERFALPRLPTTPAELVATPRLHYAAFEQQHKLVLGGLHIPDLFDRMRAFQVQGRFKVVRKLIDELAPRRSPQERRLAAANVAYHLGATAWQFFRFYFGLSLDESIAAAETAIGQFLDGLRSR
jgi:AcrR family transcriptional regulator